MGTIGEPADTMSVAISPDGLTVATDPRTPEGWSDIWLHDLVRGSASRFTVLKERVSYPLWAPDGSRVAFSGNFGKSYVHSSKWRSGVISTCPMTDGF